MLTLVVILLLLILAPIFIPSAVFVAAATVFGVLGAVRLIILLFGSLVLPFVLLGLAEQYELYPLLQTLAFFIGLWATSKIWAAVAANKGEPK
jgi:hypothetical protein